MDRIRNTAKKRSLQIPNGRDNETPRTYTTVHVILLVSCKISKMYNLSNNIKVSHVNIYSLCLQAGIFLVLENLRSLVLLDSSAMEDYLYTMQGCILFHRFDFIFPFSQFLFPYIFFLSSSTLPQIISEQYSLLQNFFSKSSVLDAALVGNSGSHFGIRKLFLSLNKYHEDKLSIFHVVTLLFPQLEQLKLPQLHTREQLHLDNLGHLKHLRQRYKLL